MKFDEFYFLSFLRVLWKFQVKIFAASENVDVLLGHFMSFMMCSSLKILKYFSNKCLK